MPDSKRPSVSRVLHNNGGRTLLRRELTKTLLPQRNPLELLETVLLRSAVNHSVLEQIAVDTVVVYGRLDAAAAVFSVAAEGLNLPRVTALVVHQARVVVALVEVLQHGREDLGLLVGEGDALGRGGRGGGYGGRGADDVGGAAVKVGAEGVLEKGRCAKDVFVGGEEALFCADDESYDCGGEVAIFEEGSVSV